MASVFRASESHDGYRSVIDGQTCDTLSFCRFGLIDLAAGRRYQGHTQDAEVVLVILGGRARIRAGGKEWASVGERADVFQGRATAAYVPAGSEYEVAEAAGGTLRVAVCGVKAEAAHEPFLVTPDEVVVHHRGAQTWRREVHDIIADNGDGRVERIVIGETYSSPGGWSSYPPHKHDRVSDAETALEEIYFFQMEPQQGFAVQLLYTEDGEICESHIVRHGDSFAIHRGYHPVAAAGGYKVYYLWFLGGAHGRRLVPFDQPSHRWLHEAR